MARTARSPRSRPPPPPRPRAPRSQVEEIIRASGLTIAEWSAILRVHSVTIHRWKSGAAKPEGLAGDVFRAASTMTPRRLAELGEHWRDVLRLRGSMPALADVLSECSTQTQ